MHLVISAQINAASACSVQEPGFNPNIFTSADALLMEGGEWEQILLSSISNSDHQTMLILKGPKQRMTEA
jgi:hypothetical protein